MDIAEYCTSESILSGEQQDDKSHDENDIALEAPSASNMDCTKLSDIFQELLYNFQTTR